MRDGPLGNVLDYIRRLVGKAADADAPDRELLKRFACGGDESAFTSLLQRHAPLVLGVCRRILHDPHDVDDAFQATFMVLARKASAIRRGKSLGTWLYQVAYRVALKVRAQRARRQEQERPLGTMNEIASIEAKESMQPAALDPALETMQRELRLILDDELSRLPGKYRGPLVLCDMQGKSHKEAAAELGWPAGSIAKRLEFGRNLLRERLELRGAALSAAMLGTVLSSASAAAPASLLNATTKAAVLFVAGKVGMAGAASTSAAVLAEGVLHTMFVTKVKIAAAMVLTIGILGTGAATGVWMAHGFGNQKQSLTANSEAVSEVFGAKEGGEKEKPARLDLHGDPLPEVALARLGTLRWRHGGHVVFMAYLPGGKNVLTVTEDSLVRVWKAGTGKEQRKFKITDSITRRTVLALSPDGKFLAASKPGEGVRLVDVATGKELRQIKDMANLCDIVFSPDGKTLAGKTWKGLAEGVKKEPPVTIHLWEVDTGKKIRAIEASPSVFYSANVLVFSPDGKTVATEETERNDQKQNDTYAVKILDVATGKEIQKIQSPEAVTFIGYSPDGKILAFDSGKVVRLCDAATGKELRKLEGQETSEALLFTPDGKFLAVRDDRKINLWEVATGKFLHQLEANFRGLDKVTTANGVVFRSSFPEKVLAFSPDAKTLAAGVGPSVRFWDSATGKPIPQAAAHLNGLWSVKIFPDGRAATWGEYQFRVWEAATGKELQQLECPGNTSSIALSADAKLAATGSDKIARVYELATGKELHKFEDDSKYVSALAFTPDGTKLASRWADDIRVFDTVTGKEIRKISVPTEIKRRSWASVLAFSPDGRTLAADANDSLCLWDMATGKEIRKLSIPKGCTAFSFLPDGKTLATENQDHTITLWEIATGIERGKIGQPIKDALPKPNEGISIEIANAVTLTLAFFVRGTDAVIPVSPDGRILAAHGINHTIRLWDIGSNKEIAQLKGHRGDIRTISFSPDGKTLISGSGDTTALVWDMAAITKRLEQPAPVQLEQKELEEIWKTLADLAEGVKAWNGINRLAAAPKQSILFLQESLKSIAPVDVKIIQQLIADLNSDKFEVRKNADEELEKLGELAVEELKKAKENKPTLEVSKRVEELLNKAAGKRFSSEELRTWRGIEVLEKIGSSEAREVLEKLAKGAPGHRITEDAQRALDGLKKR